MFAAIVEQPFEELKKILLGHFTTEKEIRLSEMYEHIDAGHDELSAALIHHLYLNYNAFMLLTKSQGTRFESAAVIMSRILNFLVGGWIGLTLEDKEK